VREALRILEKDSVVRILPNRGAHVTQLTIKEVGDIFEIRRDLVGAMVRRLARDDAFIARDRRRGAASSKTLAKEPAACDAYLARSDRLGRCSPRAAATNASPRSWLAGAADAALLACSGCDGGAAQGIGAHVAGDRQR
jgi:hypothetical protein